MLTVDPSPAAGARVAHAHPVFPGERTVSLQLCQDDASYSVVVLNRQMSSQSDAGLRRAAPRRMVTAWLLADNRVLGRSHGFLVLLT